MPVCSVLDPREGREVREGTGKIAHACHMLVGGAGSFRRGLNVKMPMSQSPCETGMHLLHACEKCTACMHAADKCTAGRQQNKEGKVCAE